MLQHDGVSLFLSPRMNAEEKAIKSRLSWVSKRPSDQKPRLCLGPGRKACKKSPGLPIKILLAHSRVFVFFLVQTVVWERQRNKVLGSVEISDKDFSSWRTQGQPHQLCQVFPPPRVTRQRSWLKALWGGGGRTTHTHKRWPRTSKSTHCWSAGRSLFPPLSF